MKLKQIFESTKQQREDAFEWARGWTNFPTPHHIPTGDLLKALFDVLPLRNRIKLYRGLRFKTQEEYKQFRAHCNNFTTLNSTVLTSWTPDPEYAAHYSGMDDPDDAYASVVIVCSADKNKGFDLRKAEDTEYEVVLMPATYSIKLYKEAIHK